MADKSDPEPIKEGDVVMLRSGSSGPQMTVGSFDQQGDALCFWIVAGTEMRSHRIPKKALKRVEPK